MCDDHDTCPTSAPQVCLSDMISLLIYTFAHLSACDSSMCVAFTLDYVLNFICMSLLVICKNRLNATLLTVDVSMFVIGRMLHTSPLLINQLKESSVCLCFVPNQVA